MCFNYFALLVIFFTLTLVNCQITVDTQKSQSALEAKAMQEQINREWPDKSEVIFILADQKVIEDRLDPPDGFYIKGAMEGGRFFPKTNILGVGELAKAGRYGWLELTSKEFYPMESDRKALSPFVKGYMTDAGFIPSVRTVFEDR